MESPERHPLPPNVLEMYREYKKRHKIVVDWIFRNGRAVANADSKQRSTVEYLDKMVTNIVSRRVEIPNDILYTAKSMLKMRHEVKLHYDGLNSSDDGHDLCNKSLQKILSKLESLPRAAASWTPKRATCEEVVDAERGNRFSLLSSVCRDHPNFMGRPSVADISSPCSVNKTNYQKDNTSQPSQVHVKKPVTAPIAEPEAVGTERIEASLLRHIINAHFAIDQAYKICIEAHHNRVPAIVAAYVAEQAFVVNYTQRKKLQGIAFGPLPELSLEAKIPRCLIEALECSAECFVTFANSDLQFWSFDAGFELGEPLECTKTFCSALQEARSSNLAVVPLRKSLPYRPALPRPESTEDYEQYYIRILQTMEMSVANWKLRREVGEFPMCEHNFLTRLFHKTSEHTTLPIQWIITNAVQFLLRTAQCFEYGLPQPLRSLPNTGEAQSKNYRLRSLSFVQEVLKSVTAFLSYRSDCVSGFNTEMNLGMLQKSLEAYLKDNCFDLITQHPLIALSDTTIVLDLVYKFGFQVMAYLHNFVGPLHVYNALHRAGVLDEEIPLLEELCNKFNSAVFFGSRPTKKFLKLWKALDDSSNIACYASGEYRKLMKTFQNMRSRAPVEREVDLQYTFRGQWLWPDQSLGYNKRLDANDFSLFHRVYNQHSNAVSKVGADLVDELVSNYTSRVSPGKSENVPVFQNSSDERCLEQAKVLVQHGYRSYVSSQLELVANALTEELNEPFPLIRANLLKISRSCYSVFKKMTPTGGEHEAVAQVASLRFVLSACDSLVEEKKGGSNTFKVTESFMNLEASTEVRDGILQKWKKAFEDEFAGTTLKDFQWQSL